MCRDRKAGAFKKARMRETDKAFSNNGSWSLEEKENHLLEQKLNIKTKKNL